MVRTRAAHVGEYRKTQVLIPIRDYTVYTAV